MLRIGTRTPQLDTTAVKRPQSLQRPVVEQPKPTTIAPDINGGLPFRDTAGLQARTARLPGSLPGPKATWRLNEGTVVAERTSGEMQGHQEADSVPLVIINRPEEEIPPLVELAPAKIPTEGNWLGVFSRPTASDDPGHALVAIIQQGKVTRIFETPRGVTEREQAPARIAEFADYSESKQQPVNGMLVQLSEADLQRVENVLPPGEFNHRKNNCAHYAEDVYEFITGNDLKVAGELYAGIANPWVLSHHILSGEHVFESGRSHVVIGDAVRQLKDLGRPSDLGQIND